MNTDNKITGVILAGGKNSRMGSDKGLLMVGGKRIAERIMDAMLHVTKEVMIITNGKNYDYFGCPVYNDLYKESGPMGGIHTALHYSKTDKILVVSCDMPFITKNVLAAIVSNSDGYDVTIPERNEGDVEPLCAVYSKSCLNTFQELLEKGSWKMQDSLMRFKVHRLHFPVNELSNHRFLNVNTPAEYESINQIKNEYSS